MDFKNLNLKYKNIFFTNKTIENLEKYVLSEIHPPISDYSNAVKIIRDENRFFSSIQLIILESYFCYTQLYCKSQLFPFLEEAFSTLTKEEKAIFYYLKALSFFEKKQSSKSMIKEALDKSISYKVPFVSNFLYRAELEENETKKDDFLSKGYENVRRIYTVDECKTVLDEKFLFDIKNYIDSEIKSINLTDIQLMLLFPNKIGNK